MVWLSAFSASNSRGLAMTDTLTIFDRSVNKEKVMATSFRQLIRPLELWVGSRKQEREKEKGSSDTRQIPIINAARRRLNGRTGFVEHHFARSVCRTGYLR